MTNDFGRQDIRLAVVLNGGVSLAIWISGVTLELHHLAMARRWDETTYGPVLDLMNADARVDVIAGTSAGGLNGAFLALGLTRDRDLTMMRDLWRDHGSLEKLLRDPLRDRRPPSLLMGDDYFLPEVRDALDRMLDQDPPGRSTGDLGDSPVELILTGTLWQGRTSSFTDDMGAAITEMDHDATFHFSLGPGGDAAGEDRSRGGLVDQLAAAARCTSSFPAAFEPHYVGITDWTKVGEGPWASTAGPANFRDPQYLVDGGVLLNKPVRPALEEVYKQTGEFLVRRVLAYVVPHPGESQVPGEAATPAQRPPVPQAREVLLGVLTRLRSTDSVARELTEIRNRNADTQARGRGRGTSRSAPASPPAPPAGSWPQVRNARQAAGANAT
jgi:patatin-related protein